MAVEEIRGVGAGIMAARSGGLILFALCAAVQDFRKRSILLWLFWVFSAFGLGLMAAELFFGSQEADLRSLLLRGSAFLPGLLLLPMARFSGGAVGMGDALYLLTAAFYLQAGELMGVFLGGLLLSGGAALLILASGSLSGKDRGKEPLPFAVFLLPAVILTLYLKYAAGPG